MSKEMREMINKVRYFITEDIEFVLNKQNKKFDSLEDDYGIKDVSNIRQDIIKFSKTALKTFRDKVPIWDNIKIIFVNNIQGGYLGMFRSGTSSSVPIVLMSEKNILAGAKE